MSFSSEQITAIETIIYDFCKKNRLQVSANTIGMTLEELVNERISNKMYANVLKFKITGGIFLGGVIMWQLKKWLCDKTSMISISQDTSDTIDSVFAVGGVITGIAMIVPIQ